MEELAKEVHNKFADTNMQVCKSTIPWVLDVYWFSPHSTQSVSAKRGRIGLGVVASVCVGGN